jgi:hypothetical protein
MGIHDKSMLRIDCAPVADTIETAGQVRIGAIVDDRSEAGLKADSVRVYWRVSGSPTFDSMAMTAGATPDSFYAYVPGQAPGTTVEYYVFAADHSNRRETRPAPAPAGSYKYFVALDPAGVDAAPEGGAVAALELSPVWPNPLRDATTVNYRLSAAGSFRLSVVDVTGREVETLVDGWQAAGGHSVQWNGRDANGREVGNGVYFIQARSATAQASRRLVVMR